MENIFAAQSSSLNLGSALIFLVLSLIVIMLAKVAGYFRFPNPFYPLPMPLIYPLGAFVIYISASLFLVPIVYFTTAYIKMGSIHGVKLLAPEIVGYLQFISLSLLAILLIGYLFLISPTIRNYIVWGRRNIKESKVQIFLKNYGFGMLSCLICYPLMVFANAIGALISVLIWKKSGVEQLAVKSLSDTVPYPVVFFLMALAIIFIVPFVEELLFRGFLQNWLKQRLGRLNAIFLVAILFSLVHYSPTQGSGNLELILSLFVLACFLGFIYERQSTIWASYGLHTTFNAITIISIVMKAYTQTT